MKIGALPNFETESRPYYQVTAVFVRDSKDADGQAWTRQPTTPSVEVAITVTDVNEDRHV